MTNQKTHAEVMAETMIANATEMVLTGKITRDEAMSALINGLGWDGITRTGCYENELCNRIEAGRKRQMLAGNVL